jgi:hypothetical protein
VGEAITDLDRQAGGRLAVNIVVNLHFEVVRASVRTRWDTDELRLAGKA